MNKKLAAIFIAYVLYASLFIYNTSVVIDGERYFIIHDDAVISMQYAKNFARGSGLVWSAGEKVEGFTNPLWTFYMSIPHFLHVPLSKTALFIQLTALVFMLLTLGLVWKISESYTALIFTAFFFPLNYWFYMGMEVSALTFLITLIIYNIIKKDSPLTVYLLCALMTLIRIDMFLIFAAVMLVYRKEWKKGAVIFVSVLALQTLVRYLYYGEILPNTYYLKVYGYPVIYRLVRSTVSIANNLYHMNFLIFILPLAFLKKREHKIMMFFVGLEFLYTIYIGGDVWEQALGGTNRFITMVMPLFFIVFAYSFYELMKKLNVKNKYVVALLLAALFININAIKELKSIKNMFSPLYDTVAGANTVKIALYIKNNFGDNVTIATLGAGVLPYFSDKKHYIDLHGKNDKYLARRKVNKIHSLYEAIISAPGHIKFDQEYSIISKKPDIIVHHIHDGKILPYLNEHYVEMKKPGFEQVWIKKQLYEKMNNT